MSAQESSDTCHAQEAELAVTLLYELGEGASEEAFKPGSGALGQLALGELLPCIPADNTDASGLPV